MPKVKEKSYTATLDEAIAPLAAYLGPERTDELRRFAAIKCHDIKFECQASNRGEIRTVGMLKAIFVMRELAPIIDNMSE